MGLSHDPRTHPIRVILAVCRRGRRPVRRLCRLTGSQPEVRTGTLDRLAARLPGQLSTPGDDGYAAATAIWSKPAGRMPDGVVHCQTPLGLRTQEMLRTSTLLAEPSALAPTSWWQSPPSTT